MPAAAVDRSRACALFLAAPSVANGDQRAEASSAAFVLSAFLLVPAQAALCGSVQYCVGFRNQEFTIMRRAGAAHALELLTNERTESRVRLAPVAGDLPCGLGSIEALLRCRPRRARHSGSIARRIFAIANRESDGPVLRAAGRDG
jgi:hypothetical protein